MYTRQIKRQQVIMREVRSRISIDEKKLKETYEKSSGFEVQVRARHILLRLKSNASAQEIERVKTKIDQLKMQIQSGKSFREIADQFSEDPSVKSNHGDLGFFKKMEMVESFSKVAFDLTPGILSDPVRTPLGYHLIEVLEKKRVLSKPFKTIKDELLQQEFQRLFSVKLDQYIQGLKKRHELLKRHMNKLSIFYSFPIIPVWRYTRLRALSGILLLTAFILQGAIDIGAQSFLSNQRIVNDLSSDVSVKVETDSQNGSRVEDVPTGKLVYKILEMPVPEIEPEPSFDVSTDSSGEFEPLDQINQNDTFHTTLFDPDSLDQISVQIDKGEYGLALAMLMELPEQTREELSEEDRFVLNERRKYLHIKTNFHLGEYGLVEDLAAQYFQVFANGEHQYWGLLSVLGCPFISR